MTILETMAVSGIVPVVVLEDASRAVDTARALLAGGIGVMEITFRTAAAADSICAVAQNCPRNDRWRRDGYHPRTVQNRRQKRRKIHRCTRI